MIFDLRCRGEAYCLNVLPDEAEFTWKLSGCERQFSARVDVYAGKTRIYAETVRGGAQRLRPSKPLPLKALEEYTWTVTVKTDKGKEVSERARFAAGLIDGFPKEVKWIGNGCRFVEENEQVGSPAAYFKRTFTIDKEVRKAVVNACGLGMYELYINGKKVGDRVLEPAFTQYDKRTLYSTYEVAKYLQTGENVVEAIVGDGWYNQTTRDTWGFYRAAWRDNVKFAFCMDYDGKRLTSDRDWSVSCGYLRSTALRTGEKWDFTAKTDYAPAVLTAPPGGTLCPAYLPPVRECETLLPIKAEKGEVSPERGDGKEENKSGALYTHFRSEYTENGAVCTQRITVISEGKASVIPKNRTITLYFKNVEAGSLCVQINGRVTAFEEKLADCLAVALPFKAGKEYVVTATFEKKTEAQARVDRAANVLLRSEGKNAVKCTAFDNIEKTESVDSYKKAVVESELGEEIKLRLLETV